MLKFVTTLKSGGDFKPYDAITLCRQVKRYLKVPHAFICMTDMVIDHPWITNIQLNDNYPGWWSMVEMFRNIGPVITSGLDMLVIGNIDRLGEMAISCPPDVFYMTRPINKRFQQPGRWRSGLQIYNGDWSWLYNGFDLARDTTNFRGEENYTQARLKGRKTEIRAVQDGFISGAGMYSYKYNCRDRGKPPADARIIFFHGKPRPCECQEDWVKQIYGNENEYTHPFETFKKEECETI